MITGFKIIYVSDHDAIHTALPNLRYNPNIPASLSLTGLPWLPIIFLSGVWRSLAIPISATSEKLSFLLLLGNMLIYSAGDSACSNSCPYDGNNLEDVGLVEAAGIDDAYNKLYESHGYNNISDCVTMIPLEDLLRELIYSSDILPVTTWEYAYIFSR